MNFEDIVVDFFENLLKRLIKKYLVLVKHRHIKIVRQKKTVSKKNKRRLLENKILNIKRIICLYCQSIF